MRKKVSFLAIVLIGLLAFSSCAIIPIKFAPGLGKEFEKLGINPGNKESILRLEREPDLFWLWCRWTPIQDLMLREEKELVKKILAIEDKVVGEDSSRKFINFFWLRRDDNPHDDANEVKEKFYGRVIESETRFAGRESAQYYRRCKYGKGWETHLGRLYIVLGEPYIKERHSIEQLLSVSDAYETSPFLPQDIEVWFYDFFALNIDDYEYEGSLFNDGVAYIIFEKDHAWEFVGEGAYYLAEGYMFYNPCDVFGRVGYGQYQVEVYTHFLQAVAKGYIYDWDLEFEDIN